MTKRNREAGQSILLMAFALTVLLGIMGLAIDFGYLRHMRTRLQSAADAAAIAGAGNLPLGSTGLTTAAQDAATSNGFSLSATSGSCTPSAGQIAVNNPPCYLSAAQDPYNGNASVVEAVLSQSTPTAFARLFGVSAVTIVARAEAEYDTHPNCVFATDPTNKWSFYNSGNTFIASCGAIVESNDSRALKCAGNSGSLQLPFLGVNGGDQGCSVVTPPVYPNLGQAVVPSPPDPLSYLTVPSVGNCGTTTSSPYTGFPGIGSGHNATGLIINGTATLNPGVYCGGIQLGSGADVTFNSGTYILAGATNKNGTSLGLTIAETSSASLVASGSDVTFYNTEGGQNGPPGAINIGCLSNHGSSLSLIAPASGSMKGILIWQDSADVQDAEVMGQQTPSTILQGALYFPGDISSGSAHPQLGFYYSNPNSQYTIIVAKDICLPNPGNGATCPATQCGGSIVVNSNYSSLTGGSPIKGKSGTLVE